jgi:hypothetical protein
LDAFIEYSLARIENRSRQLMSIFLKLLQVVPKARLLAAPGCPSAGKYSED